MQEKEVFYKKMNKKYFIYILFITIVFLRATNATESEQFYRTMAFEYLNNIEELESSFLQIQNNDIKKGKFYIKNGRLRVDYDDSAKITFIIKKNNAMYYNQDLQEVQYFNPKKNNTKIFFDLFNDREFLNDAKISINNKMFYFAKELTIANEKNIIKIFFEEYPINIRKLEIINNNGLTAFYINNTNFNPNLNDKIFSLANPLIN